MEKGKIWITSKARMQAEKRLLSHANQSQYLLLWYSFSTIAVSIYYLKFNVNSPYSDIVWVEFSLLVCIVSVFIQTNTFKERAALIKECYIKLGALDSRSNEMTDEIVTEEYKAILETCENHVSRDHYRAICEVYLLTPTNKRIELTHTPTLYVWANCIFSFISAILVLATLYSLPLLIFYITGSP
jgi:hypothetical protein